MEPELEEEEIEGDERILRMSLKLLLSSSGKIVTRSDEENVLLVSLASPLVSPVIVIFLETSELIAAPVFPLRLELLALFGM